ncbi:MAG: CapA family protein [Deltaproteobacteria bacterium]|nr:CapA family protein [Deltaproteobacteria bacterium]
MDEKFYRGEVEPVLFRVFYLMVLLSVGVVAVFFETTKATAEENSRAVRHNRSLSIAVGGDVMFGRAVENGWRAHGTERPFGIWTKILVKADLAFINLETGICEQGRTGGNRPLFWAPPDRLDALVNAGIDVVSVANNHVLDCGPRGLDSTLVELKRRRIFAAGVAPGGTVRVGRDVVVFAATQHRPPYRSSGKSPFVQTRRGPFFHELSDDTFIKNIARIRRSNSRKLLIASLHWGKERSDRPAAFQQVLAQQMINAGANAIVGHGPHAAQLYELYRQGIILYSLGNLVFDDRTKIGRPQPPAVLRFIRGNKGWQFKSISWRRRQ